MPGQHGGYFSGQDDIEDYEEAMHGRHEDDDPIFPPKLKMYGVVGLVLVAVVLGTAAILSIVTLIDKFLN